MFPTVSSIHCISLYIKGKYYVSSNKTIHRYQFTRGPEFLISYQGVLITFSYAESMLTTVYCCHVLTFLFVVPGLVILTQRLM